MYKKSSAEVSRKKLSVYATLANIFYLSVRFGSALVVRMMFIHYIGVEALGINALFQNLLGFFSIADLGISTALNIALFKPVEEKNFGKVKALLKLYRKMYYIVAGAVTCISVVLAFFLPDILKEAINYQNVIVIYFLFVARTLIPYVLLGKRPLLNSDLKQYLIINIETAFTLFLIISQIIIIYTTNSFLLYIVADVLVFALHKIFLWFFAAKRYSKINQHQADVLEKSTSGEIIKNASGAFISQISTVFTSTIDNALLAVFTNMIKVGIYSNYLILYTSLQTLVGATINSLLPITARLSVSKGVKKEMHAFKTILFCAHLLGVFLCGVFMLCVQPFIKVWLGSDMQLDWYVSFGFAVLLLFLPPKNVANNFILQNHLIWKTKQAVFFETFINFGLTIFLMGYCHFDYLALILAPIIAGALTGWYRPYLLNREVYKITAWSIARFTLKYVNSTIFCVALFVGALFLRDGFSDKFSSTIQIVFGLLVAVFVTASSALLFFRKTNEFHQIIKRSKQGQSPLHEPKVL